jgi:hypothetical protein
MLEFLLRYKVPEEACTDKIIEDVELQAQKMADRIQTLLSTIFSGWDVCFEIREFGDTKGMPDFYVTVWITDKFDLYKSLAKEAEVGILAAMIQLAPKDKSVGVWFQRVKSGLLVHKGFGGKTNEAK